jgi:xanthine dehydrogenase small subunit
MRNKIVFFLNGTKEEVGSEHAGLMLSDYLRLKKNLTGTKVVCAEGDCGACSVLRYFPQNEMSKEDTYLPINSCITLVANLDGSSLVTVEALKEDDKFHVSQKAMIECHGSQCGFCTPGFVIALTGLVEKKISQNKCSLTTQEAKNALTGNLCRCTGYEPIINSALNMDLQSASSLKTRYFSKQQELELKKTREESVQIEGSDFSYFAPKTLNEALDYLKQYPQARITGATTDLGVVHNKRKIQLNHVLSLHLIENFYRIEKSGDEITIGARVTLSDFRSFMKIHLPEMAHYLDIFASPQIKNLATVVGNVANASPIGDTPPALLALRGRVVINDSKEIPLENFFKGYRQTALGQGEIITAIKMTLPKKNADLRFYKNSNRKDLDISAINLAIHTEWKNEEKTEIEDIIIAAGGVAAIPMRMVKTEDFFKQNNDLKGALSILHQEFNPLSDLRASSAYRHVLVENFIKRFFSECGGLQ